MLLQAQGDLAGARPYYERALAIWQERRDHHREGAAFFQLGRLALQFNHPAGGARLVALHYLIDRQFGHPDTEQAWRTLTQLAAYLGWSQAALDTTLQEVAAAYRADEGRDLLAAAFADTPAAQERRTGRAATAAGAGGRYHKRRIRHYLPVTLVAPDLPHAANLADTADSNRGLRPCDLTGRAAECPRGSVPRPPGVGRHPARPWIQAAML